MLHAVQRARTRNPDDESDQKFAFLTRFAGSLESNHRPDVDTDAVHLAEAVRPINLARLSRDLDPIAALTQARDDVASARRSGDQRVLFAGLVAELTARRAVGEPVSSLLADASRLVAGPQISLSQRVDLLIEISTWEAASGYRDAAVATAFEARRQALAVGDEIAVARATLRLAIPAVFSRVDRTTVLAALNEAADRCSGVGFAPGEASARFHSGVALLFTMNDPIGAAAQFTRTRALVIEPTVTGATWTCAQLSLEAIARSITGDVAGGRRLISQASALAARYDSVDPRVPPVVRFARGVAAASGGDLASAVDELRLAADLSDGIGMPELTVEVLRHLAHVYQRLGDHSAVASTTSRFRDARQAAETQMFSQSWWDLAALGETFV
jgi:hypothetical protein